MGVCISGVIIALSCTTAFADANTLYEKKNSQTLTRGVTYDEITRLTKNGWQYIYVLTLDANDDNVSLDVIESTKEYGLKENTLAISQENNVVAAVNGDYFGSGNPQSSMGQVLDEGKLVETKNYYNADANNYAGFFIDTDGVPFVDYLKTSVGFYNSSVTTIELEGKNKYTNFSKPVYFDRSAMTTTASLDKRNPSLTKIVVDTGAISYISQPGETVTIPENGYVIVMNQATRNSKISYYGVGQPVSFVENGTFLFRPAKKLSQIDFGISGGGEILRNGQPMAQGEIISPGSRNPRTCIGVSQDKSKIIICCVDGRVKGIGATSYECSALMKELGAYDAIQLDGGGSTTMVIKPEDGTALETVNTPSDGAMRQVSNAVGVSSVGTATGIGYIDVDTSAKDNILVSGLDYDLTARAYDNLHNLTALPAGITYTTEGIEGAFEGGKFTPSGEGQGKIVAAYTLPDGTQIRGETPVTVLSGISMLDVSIGNSVIDVGQSTGLSIKEYNKDGFGGRNVDLSLVSFDVDDSQVGYITDTGYFVATGKGTATITARLKSNNEISGVVSVHVGKTETVVDNFEAWKNLQFLKFPEAGDFTGETAPAYGVGTSGKASVRLTYSFKPNVSSVQCAYSSFPLRIPISGTPTQLGMNVKGDNSGVILKINIRDANEKSYNIGLTDSVNFEGWQHLTGMVPADVKYPIQVMSVYAAVLTTGATAPSGTIFFDDLTADIGTYSSKAPLTNDYMANAAARTDLSPLYIVSPGVNAQSLGLGGMATSWYSNYTTAGDENISIINLATDGGTLLKSNNTQIRYFADYADRLSSNNIVVMVKSDMYATGSGKFADSREAEIVHEVLKNQYLKGKRVAVVSCGGTISSVNIKDGVRYINIAERSSSKPVLTFRYSGNELYYGYN